ncbi:unnamed protein product [Vitrella brassicaformis CCMP3155]|uniref:Uncharacterized protein n=2 Tax=Vitrella brassicaformis TaxID=1169539 RepID=A0A0G4FBN6_VITBC|nr:unnamed protein product [Vitrella brassicaformis CCMP3155]|eukprot:CEM10290.1 unnamed protein product [Vitrella brassicaformis CCMP3155]
MISEDTQQQQPNQQQHPIEYIFVGRRSFYLLSLDDILKLRATCRWLRELFKAPQLRQRLSHSLSTQAGLRRTANGQQLLTFDQQQMGVGDLLAALCVAEAGGWSEMSEAVELAGQCGNCQLPVRLTAADLHQYPNKTAYLAAPRVLAQLKMVGPHIDFGGGVTFQLFHHGDTLRAVKDQDGFEIDISPPLYAAHLYQQDRQPHDPPVRSRIDYRLLTGWRLLPLGPYDYSSVSSLVKRNVLNHFRGTHQLNSTGRTRIDRLVDNNRLLNLMTHSPHTPVEGCTTTASYRFAAGFTSHRLVLTDAGQLFVAWIHIMESPYMNTVLVQVRTAEPAVSGVGAFKDRFPVTTRLVRSVLGAVISARIFDQ